MLTANQGIEKANKATALFSFLLILCTIGTGIITWMAADAARISADAATKAATSAENTFNQNKQYAVDSLGRMDTSNQTNREALTSVQRAFLTLQEIRGERLNIPNSPGVHMWQFFGVWQNSGSTPAAKIVGDFHSERLSREPDDKKFRTPVPGQPFNQTTLGPKATEFVGSRSFPEADILYSDMGDDPRRMHERVRPGTFIWGWAAYRDVFPDTPTHVTEFCAFLAGYRINPDQNTITPMYGNCAKHNCNDQYCPDYREILKMLPKDLQ